MPKSELEKEKVGTVGNLDISELTKLIHDSVQFAVQNFKCGQHDEFTIKQTEISCQLKKQKETLDHQDEALDAIKNSLEKIDRKIDEKINSIKEERAKDKINYLKEQLAAEKEDKKEKKSTFANWSQFSVGAFLTLGGGSVGLACWFLAPLVEKFWLKLFHP